MGACVQRKLVVAAALDYWVVEFHLLSRWFLLRWSGRFSTKVAPARWMFFWGGGVALAAPYLGLVFETTSWGDLHVCEHSREMIGTPYRVLTYTD